MKKIAKYLGIFLLIGIGYTALDNVDGIMELAGILVVVLIGYVVIVDGSKRKKSTGAARQARPAKRKSFRSSFISSASDSVSRGIANTLIPRQPTAQERERERQRRDAESKYWFHQKQADRLRGTPDGEWHQNQAWNYKNKMK